ncbi:C2 domain [Pseudocohnilembus persalinus]|uniref:C2 domain n=1 Tax=Pseudocohnilembus persalinus TaxID=266149 RepID=A0A0V0QS31_PSEPJ|nr:C2 domain [Pseudocohnilembus persalinus]|eukprot:KRX05028.1 C2 domain [Pseudocohnilembus persalinus]
MDQKMQDKQKNSVITPLEGKEREQAMKEIMNEKYEQMDLTFFVQFLVNEPIIYTSSDEDDDQNSDNSGEDEEQEEENEDEDSNNQTEYNQNNSNNGNQKSKTITQSNKINKTTKKSTNVGTSKINTAQKPLTSSSSKSCMLNKSNTKNTTDPIVYLMMNKKSKSSGRAIQKGTKPIWGKKNVFQFDFRSSDRDMIVQCKHQRGILPASLIGNGIIDIVKYRAQGFYGDQIVELKDSKGIPSGTLIFDINVTLYLPKKCNKPVSEINPSQNNINQQLPQSNQSSLQQQYQSQQNNFNQPNFQPQNQNLNSNPSFNQPNFQQQNQNLNSNPSFNQPPQSYNQPQQQQSFSQQQKFGSPTQQMHIQSQQNQQNQIPQQQSIQQPLSTQQQRYDDAYLQQQLDLNKNLSDAEIAMKINQQNQDSQNKQLNFVVNNGYNYPTE